PIARFEHRLLWPRDRPLHLRAHRTSRLPRRIDPPAATEYVVASRDVATLDVDDRTPVWFEPYPYIQFSSFETWADVARWGSDLFRVTSPPSAALLALIDRLRRENTSL